MRLDIYLTKNAGVESRAKACHLIEMQRITVDGKVATKSSMDVDNKVVEVLSDMEFVSMGGYKLQKALDDFDVTMDNLVCADIGASNGGFTQCLLNHGASRVYAVDVGECAFNDILKNDERVVVVDRFNARNLQENTLGELVDIAVVDLSFISLKTVMPSIVRVVKNNGKIIALIKPQFEVGKKFLSKKGIVIDSKVGKNCLNDMITYFESINLRVIDDTIAPIRQNKNIEYLVLASKISADI